MKLASRPLQPRKISAARAETGVLCTPPAALRRTLTVTITPSVTFASGRPLRRCPGLAGCRASSALMPSPSVRNNAASLAFQLSHGII